VPHEARRRRGTARAFRGSIPIATTKRTAPIRAARIIEAISKSSVLIRVCPIRRCPRLELIAALTRSAIGCSRCVVRGNTQSTTGLIEAPSKSESIALKSDGQLVEVPRTLTYFRRKTGGSSIRPARRPDRVTTPRKLLRQHSPPRSPKLPEFAPN
jgi:hypothetical protein